MEKQSSDEAALDRGDTWLAALCCLIGAKHGVGVRHSVPGGIDGVERGDGLGGTLEQVEMEGDAEGRSLEQDGGSTVQVWREDAEDLED